MAAGNQRQRQGDLVNARNFSVGDIVLVSHGRGSGGCAGNTAIVLGATDRAFSMRCTCGARFVCAQSDAYPNHTTGRHWEPWHEEMYFYAVLRMQESARLVIAVGQPAVTEVRS